MCGRIILITTFLILLALLTCQQQIADHFYPLVTTDNINWEDQPHHSLMEVVTLAKNRWITPKVVWAALGAILLSFIFLFAKKQISVGFMLGLIGIFGIHWAYLKWHRLLPSAGPLNTARLAVKITQLDPTPNLFFSPYSLSSCLTLAYAGARNGTATEMASALGLPDQASAIRNARNAIRQLDRIDQLGDVTIENANSLWIQKNFSILSDFQTLADKDFETKIANVDFEDQNAIQAINAWCDDHTEHKIPELLAPGQLDDNTALVLCNAIYFKGGWAHPFDAYGTSGDDFITATGETTAQTMHIKEDFKFIHNNSGTLIELPYKGGTVAMVICLPKELRGLPDLIRNLSESEIDGWIKELNKTSSKTVRLNLPKWHSECNISDLSDVFKRMGMQGAFTDRADFSGASKSNGLFISDITHKARIEVAEKGTEAAAATRVVECTSAVIMLPPDTTETISVDHPFFYMVVDTQSRAVLFAGTENDPTR